MSTDQMMNKSEVQERKFDSKKDAGWICPKCGKVLSPYVHSCPCSTSKQENLQSGKTWIKD